MQTQPANPGAYTLHNAPDEIAYRRSCSTLVSVGQGVLIFSIWSMIKGLGIVFINRQALIETIRAGMDAADEPVTDTALFGLMIAIAAFYLLVLLAIRAFISICAIAEGRGRRVFFLYIPVSIIYTISELLTLITSTLTLIGAAGDVSEDTSIAAVLIELTSVILLITMISSARKVRRYKKMKTSGEIRHAA